MNWSIESYPDGTFGLCDESGNILVQGSAAKLAGYVDNVIKQLVGLRDELWEEI